MISICGTAAAGGGVAPQRPATSIGAGAAARLAIARQFEFDGPDRLVQIVRIGCTRPSRASAPTHCRKSRSAVPIIASTVR